VGQVKAHGDIFSFECCILLRVLLRLFRRAVPHNNIFKMFVLLLFLYPLHGSAPVGHPLVEYTIT
jgi:hypothetical protein